MASLVLKKALFSIIRTAEILLFLP
jgi:hypothetical protein